MKKFKRTPLGRTGPMTNKDLFFLTLKYLQEDHNLKNEQVDENSNKRTSKGANTFDKNHIQSGN